MNRCAEHPRGDPCPLLPEWAQAQIATLQSQLAEREAELKRRELKIQQLTLELGKPPANPSSPSRLAR